MTERLTGKHILVSGAGGRLGRVLVEHLEREGARVSALVRDPAKASLLPVTPGGEVRAFALDATDEASVVGAFENVARENGELHGCIHAVGTWAGGPLLETPADEFERLVRVNLTSAFLVFREASRLMSTGKGGTLVAIAAGQGADAGAAGQAGYSAAKGGLVRLVESIDAEMRAEGVRAASVAPSMILYGDENGQKGVRAAEVAAACIDLLVKGGDGGVTRVYGTMA